MNLLCAEGLRGVEYLATLDGWTDSVRQKTEHNLRRFWRNPVEGDGSEANWRMRMIFAVLQQDLHMQYNPHEFLRQETHRPMTCSLPSQETFFLLGCSPHNAWGHAQDYT